MITILQSLMTTFSVQKQLLVVTDITLTANDKYSLTFGDYKFEVSTDSEHYTLDNSNKMTLYFQCDDFIATTITTCDFQSISDYIESMTTKTISFNSTSFPFDFDPQQSYFKQLNFESAVLTYEETKANDEFDYKLTLSLYNMNGKTRDLSKYNFLRLDIQTASFKLTQISNLKNIALTGNADIVITCANITAAATTCSTIIKNLFQSKTTKRIQLAGIEPDMLSTISLTNPLIEKGTITIESEKKKYPASYYILVILVPILVVIIIALGIYFGITCKRKDRQMKSIDKGFGDPNAKYTSVFDAKKAKLTDYGFGEKFKIQKETTNKFVANLIDGESNLKDFLKLGKLVDNKTLVNVYTDKSPKDSFSKESRESVSTGKPVIAMSESKLGNDTIENPYKQQVNKGGLNAAQIEKLKKMKEAKMKII
ncbi:Hypothetical_protein [Hexamita inflata]|uniref:Hypothetical_protein n=1 Tax=Hexamita inflata TaxID=28002 RepID=A0AA86TZP9_9EUKA|nr:Hypothetical protein HINF_LOCUS13893 [Hexamita inflata]